MGILVLDFGGQYTHLIARRVRELGAYSEILSFDASVEKIQKLKPEGIILSGGPASVYEEGAPFPDKGIFSLGIPVMGICYGHQLIAKMLGGKVEKGGIKEYGKKELQTLNKEDLFFGLEGKEIVWMSHGDEVKELPPSFEAIASSDDCPIAASRGKASPQDQRFTIYSVQFHPEVVHTPKGNQVIENFIYRICGCKKEWTIKDVSKRLVEEIGRAVADEKVLIGVSGGVDSIVAATLLNKAIGERLHCIFIDNGLLRKNEKKEVIAAYEKLGFKHFHFVNAREEFLEQLKGVLDPEEKRKRIGHTFIKVFEKAAKDVSEEEGIKFFAQGTIYPDRIESAQASKKAAKIKSHHNLTLPEQMSFQIIEPLKELYKDEVRALGRELNIPEEWIKRHPFPGPGLAIRILGEITEERLAILREADAIYIEELKKSDWYDKVWQAFAALLPVKAVGVMGDQRTYEYIITLRAVNSKDGMTADWSKLPPEILERVSNRIVNEVKGVNRVLYDVSQKPPATIEYE
ncbi:glutamine-hydrolyzing GMP synthase [Candidatus Micrarchaeota archaeon]|nr:glutamine-hydrolyzing GMP synthase [Candidatus Micrarchaeota archaeon]